jgi:predicted amidohydrolase
MWLLLFFLALAQQAYGFNVAFSTRGAPLNLTNVAADFETSRQSGANVLLFAEFSFLWPSSRSAVEAACTNTSFVLSSVQKLVRSSGNVSAALVNWIDCEGGKVYNANYVVSEDGVVAKYRKSHVWFKKIFDEPETPDLVTVQLFNQTFGLFMCYDILFSSPGPALRKSGISRFLYNAAIPIVGKEVFRLWSFKEKAQLYAAGGHDQVGAFLEGKDEAKKISDSVYLATNQQ